MPITIGQLANVPNPGAPITSPWAQDVTRLGVHVFATKTALDAASVAGTWPGLADGAHAHVTATGIDYIRRAGAWRAAPGSLWGREERTTNYTANATTIAAAADIFTGVTFTADGGPLVAELYVPRIDTGGAGGGSVIQTNLMLGGASLAIVGLTGPSQDARQSVGTLLARVPFTPAAGVAVNLNARAIYVNSGNGVLYGGAGAAGYSPMVLEVRAR